MKGNQRDDAVVVIAKVIDSKITTVTMADGTEVLLRIMQVQKGEDSEVRLTVEAWHLAPGEGPRNWIYYGGQLWR